MLESHLSHWQKREECKTEWKIQGSWCDYLIDDGWMWSGLRHGNMKVLDGLFTVCCREVSCISLFMWKVCVVARRPFLPWFNEVSNDTCVKQGLVICQFSTNFFNWFFFYFYFFWWGRSGGWSPFCWIRKCGLSSGRNCWN